MAEKRKDSRGRILRDGESQRADGRYRYQYMDSRGKRQEVYSWKLVETDRTPSGKRDDLSLREKEKQIQKDLADGIMVTMADKATLNDMFHLYMSGKSELKQSSRASYFYTYQKYVSKTIGYKKITEIKFSHIKRFYSDLLKNRKFKPNSLKLVHSIIHPVFMLAVRDGYIRVNPTDGVIAELRKSNGWESSKRHALTEDEQEAFINFIADSNRYKRWLPLFTVFLGTGCRVGELTGLRWQDCDFENRTISINHNLVYRKQDNGKFETHVSTPKTSAGCRTIPMLEAVKKALLDEKKQQMQRGFSTVEIDGYSGFVFTNGKGNVHNLVTINQAIKEIYSAYNKQELDKAKKEHRQPILIRHFSSHNFRHTFCTRFCENETNLKIIQEIMGHSDIGTTMNIYAEATEAKKKEAFKNLEGKIKIS